MNNIFLKVLFLFIIGTTSTISAQQIKIKGTVADSDGIPLPSTTVTKKGTDIGVVTDFDGNYSIEASIGDVLVFSFIGYFTQEIEIGTRSIINVQLVVNLAELDEVVLIGYGTQRKSDMTGSVSSLNEDDFNVGGAVTSPEALIQGRAAGVTVATVGAAPGNEPVIRIRGNNSLLGNNSPLYIVDGMQMATLDNMINVEDIANIEVLKDASSTAAYGTRGANGVVIITTKRGAKGRTQIDYYTEYSIQTLSNTDAYIPLSSKEYIELGNYRAELAGSPEPFGPERIAIFESKGDGTNWFNELYQDGSIQRHNLSIGSSSERNSIFVSAHILDQVGVVPNTGFEQATFRLNLDQNVIKDRLDIKISSLLSSTTQDILGFGGSNSQSQVLRNIFKGGSPLVPTSFDDWTDSEQDIAFAGGRPNNPITIVDLDENVTKKIGINLSAAATVKIIDGLTYTGRIGIKRVDSKNSHFLPEVYGLVATTIPQGSAELTQSAYTSKLFESIVNYTTDINDVHHITALGVYSQNPKSWEAFSAASMDFVSNELKWDDLAAGATVLTPRSSAAESNLVSWLGRVEYGFKDRYNFSASIRSDGSSKFGTDEKWGTFPSAAVGWKIHNESFFNVNAISKLKLRASWGITGNDGFGIGAAQTVFGAGLGLSLDSDNIRKGIAAARLGNSGLKWENTTAINLGIELGLVKNRVSIEVDWYKKETDDLIWNRPVSPTLGFESQIANIGAVENEGIEVLLSTVNVSTGKFRWSSDFTFAKNSNKITELDLPPGSEFFPTATSGHQIQTSILKVGEPMGTFYGYVYDHIMQTGETAPATQTTALPGDVIWKDTNEDGIFSAADKKIIGQGIPEYTFGFNNSMSYDNFQLTFFFYGISQVDVLNLSAIEGYENSTINTSLTERWTPNNPSGTEPLRGWGRSYYTNTKTLESGAFIALKNVRLSYTLPSDLKGMAWLRDLTINLSGSNLLVFSDYSGYNAEVNSTNNDNSTVFNAQSSSIDSYAYPMQRTFSIGLNIGF